MAGRADRVRDLRLTAALVLCLLAPACGARGIASGDALLESSGHAELRLGSIPPGDEFVLLEAMLTNTSDSPITILGVRAIGPRGVGTVVHVLGAEIAPLPLSDAGYDFMPGGVFKTYPPAGLLPDRSRCNVQALVPLDGYVLDPGREARVLLRIRAVSPGRFFISSHVATYRLGDRTYEQSLQIGLEGEVVAGSRPLKLQTVEKPCASEVQVLPSA